MTLPSWHRYWMNHMVIAFIVSVIVGLIGWKIFDATLLWSYGAGCIGGGGFYLVRELWQSIFKGQPWNEVKMGAGMPILAVTVAWLLLWLCIR